MPFAAKYDGEVKRPESVPFQEDAYCLECGGVMRIQRESVDGTDRHFFHIADMNGGGSGGGNCSQRRDGGGESEEHTRCKNLAAVRLDEIFGSRATSPATNEMRLAAPESEKQIRKADACILFEEWDEQLGRGVAIEVQHKNEDKDKEAVRADYDRQGVAVAWVTPDDFHEDGFRFNEADIRYRASQATSICGAVPKWHKISKERPYGEDDFWSHFERDSQTAERLINRAHDPRGKNVEMKATIPPEYFAEEHDVRLREWLSYFDEIPQSLGEFFWNEMFVFGLPVDEPYAGDSDHTHDVEINLNITLSESLWRDQEWRNLFNVNHGWDVVRTENTGSVEARPRLNISRQTLLEALDANKQHTNRLGCSECWWVAPEHPEPDGKLLTLHVKSEHKKEIKNGKGYRDFLDCDVREIGRRSQQYIKSY